MRDKIVTKWVVGILSLLTLQTFSWGAGILFNCTGTENNYVYDSNGTTKLAAGNAVQFIKGNKSCPNPSSNYLSGGNTLLGSPGQVGEGTDGTAGTFYRAESLATGTVYARAWNQPVPSEGQNVKYGYSAYGYPSSGTAPPQPFPVPSFSLTYTAHAPAAPTLNPVSANDIGYDTALLTWSFATGYEITQVEILYGTAKTADNNVDIATGGTILLSGAPSSYKFPSYPNPNSLSPNHIYHVQVIAKNHFAGTPGKSNLVSFSTIAVPASEVGKARKLSIKANPSNNTITLNYEGVNATVFEIFRSIDQGKTWEKAAETTTLAYTDNDNLTNIPVIYYRVKAKNGVFAETTVAREIFDFTKLSIAGKQYTGINSFSIPFLPNGKAVALEDQWNPTADGFANYIHARKGNIVEFIGGWDQASQRSFGRIYKDGVVFSGTIAAQDFPLVPRKGYQLGISESVQLLIVGEVSGEKE